jgi:hypothetical protein
MAWLVMHGSSIIVFQDKTWRDGQRKSGLLAMGALIHLLLEGGNINKLLSISFFLSFYIYILQ